MTRTLSDSSRPNFLGQNNKPASIRYNNPGAMWPGPSSRKFGAIGGKGLNDGLGQGNKIAIFDDAVDGAAALFDLFDRAYTNRTVRKAISKWSGGNWVDSYLRVLKDKADLDPDVVISKAKLRDPEFAVRFAKAMAWHEAGQEYPLDDEHWNLAHSEAFSSIPSTAQSRAHEERKQAVKEAVKKSWTVRGALVALLGVVTEAIYNAAGFAGEAIQATADLGPLQQLAGNLGANIPAIGAGLTIGGLVIVLARRLSDAGTGKSG